MDRPAENTAEDDPKENNRAKQSAADGPEDGAGSGDIQ